MEKPPYSSIDYFLEKKLYKKKSLERKKIFVIPTL